MIEQTKQSIKILGGTIMIEQTKQSVKSRELAVKLYDNWVRQRQNRPEHEIPTNEKELKQLGLKNLVNQLIEPRRRHLKELKEVSKDMNMADKVALLVKLEIPVLETSALLHKLSMQLTEDSNSSYFSKVNQNDNCGSGCGCGCAAMASLPYEERINAHHVAKPFSIDPFNELDTPERERDALLIKDFLDSYEVLSSSISKQVNQRYFRMGSDFG